jgi:ribonuclease J
MSSTNIDRLFSFYHAALTAGIPFFVDAYQKKIMDIIVESDSLWGKSKLYQYDKDYPPIPLRRDGAEFMVSDSFKAKLSQKGYVLIARANSRFDRLLKKLPGEKVKYLSMWKGYMDKRNAAYNGNLANSLGDKYVYLHTSGHIDMENLEQIFEILQPNTIIPLHTDNPNTFAALFGNKWNVLKLHDGESYELI